MRTPALLAAAMTLSALLAGCVEQSKYDRLSAQVIPLQDQAKKFQQANDDLQARNEALQKQVDSLLALGSRRLELIPHTATIELGSYTGGFNSDVTQKYQNAVKVYLMPTDRDGSVIKAPGEVKIQLYDLAETKNPLLGEYTFTPEQVAKNWFSGVMMAYHYSFVCPWQRPPLHNEVTVRVEFVDYVTGQHFTTQKVVTVNPAPASQPAK